MALKAVPYDPLHMEFMEVHPAFAGAFSREDHTLWRARVRRGR
jgi:hypothetical protein